MNIKKFFNTDIDQLIFKNKPLNKSDHSFFCRQLSFLLSSGINLATGLNLLAKIHKNKRFEKALHAISRDIIKGHKLCDAIKNTNKFEPFFCQMIAISSKVAKADIMTQQLEEYYQKELEYIKTIKGILIYPSISLVAIVIVSIIAYVFLIPNFADLFIFYDADLPIITTIFLGIFSNFYYILFGVFMFMLLIIVPTRFEFTRKIIDKYLYKLPIIRKIFIFKGTSRFCYAMALMLDSGALVPDSVLECKYLINNQFYKEQIIKIAQIVIEGNSLATAISIIKKSEVLHPILLNTLHLAEETGNTTKAFFKNAMYFDKELNLFMLSLKKIIEPATTIFLGLLLLFLLLAIMLPTFYLAQIL